MRSFFRSYICAFFFAQLIVLAVFFRRYNSAFFSLLYMFFFFSYIRHFFITSICVLLFHSYKSAFFFSDIPVLFLLWLDHIKYILLDGLYIGVIQQMDIILIYPFRNHLCFNYRVKPGGDCFLLVRDTVLIIRKI